MLSLYTYILISHNVRYFYQINGSKAKSFHFERLVLIEINHRLIDVERDSTFSILFSHNKQLLDLRSVSQPTSIWLFSFYRNWKKLDCVNISFILKTYFYLFLLRSSKCWNVYEYCWKGKKCIEVRQLLHVKRFSQHINSN